jgi:hypothetical protein
MLFKAEERGTGEDWAEKLACELCRRIGLPHVDCDLAEEYNGEDYLHPSVVCPHCAPAPLSLILGNELLLAHDPDYPKEDRRAVGKPGRRPAAATFCRAGTVGILRFSRRHPPAGNSRGFSALRIFRPGAGWDLAASEASEQAIGGVTREEIEATVREVPPDRMTDVTRRFTVELVVTNQHRLLNF